MADEPTTTKSTKSKSGGGEFAVTTTLEEATEAGLFGVEVDPTPNHAYTIEGVGAEEPTPETDEGAKAAADARRAELNDALSGKGGE